MGARAGDREDFIGDGTGKEYVRGPVRGTGKILLETEQARNMCRAPRGGRGRFFWRRDGRVICAGPRAGDGEEYFGDGTGG